MNEKYIKENGFYVNTENGECLDELVFETRPKQEAIPQFHSDFKKIKFKNPTLKKINNYYNVYDQKKYNVKKSVEKFLHECIFSIEVKNTLKNQVLKINHKNSTEAIISLCKIIYKRNLPITTRELFIIIDKFANKHIIKKTIGKPKRDYYWYINRLLSNFKFLTLEEYQQIYNKIYTNYKKLSEALSLNSPAFISTITYFTMIANFPDRKFRYFDFGTGRPTIILHRKKLEKLGLKLPKKKKSDSFK